MTHLVELKPVFFSDSWLLVNHLLSASDAKGLELGFRRPSIVDAFQAGRVDVVRLGSYKNA